MQMPTAKSAGNTTWWTDPTIPDPADLPTVRGWRILVRPIPNAPKTKGGIIIPDATIETMDLIRSVGQVKAVGPMAYTRPDMETSPGAAWEITFCIRVSPAPSSPMVALSSCCSTTTKCWRLSRIPPVSTSRVLTTLQVSSILGTRNAGSQLWKTKKIG